MDPSPARVTRSVRLEVDLDAAWRLVGTEEGLGLWLGGEVEIDACAGGALRVRDDHGVVRTGRVLDVDAGRRLVFAWGDAEGGDPSTVTLTVDEDDAGASRVTVVEERAGGSVAACRDVGVAWDHRMLHLELGALATVPAFAGRVSGDGLL